jgi:hypothetical protein
MTAIRQADGFLDGFRREMRQIGAAELDGGQIASRLRDHLVTDCGKRGAPIAELFQWAFNVEIELTTGAMWTIECLGDDAYHVYPAHIREDGTAVPNIWVAEDMTLDEMIAQARVAVGLQAGEA